MIALCSTTNKAELTKLCRGLVQLGWEIWGTEGTSRHLLSEGVPARSTTEALGVAPIMGGRVKTLHWTIFGSLLCDRTQSQHLADARIYNLPQIGMVVADIYHFVQSVEGSVVEFRDAQSLIDIGGTANIRAAAKNFEHVIPLVDRDDYSWVLERLIEAKGEPGGVDRNDRCRLAAKVFSATARHDAAIAHYLDAEAQRVIAANEG